MGDMLNGRPSSAVRPLRLESGSPVLSARSGAALGVLVVLIAILAIPFREWITQRARIAQLEDQLSWHTQRVVDLKASLARWDDPAFVEAQSRARLHFVRPGEVGYTVLTDQHQQQSAASATRPMVKAPAGVPWWSAVWDTVQQADSPPPGGIPQAPPEAKPAPTYSQ